jgi:ribosome maturation factor RimP
VDPSGRVRDLVAPVLGDLGADLFDVELTAGILRISIDRAGQQGGVDLDLITAASERISEVLDRDPDLIPGRYSLEVSSPGLERALRTPVHFGRFVGTTISVKTKPDVEGERRIQATLDAADDEGISIAGRRLSYGQIERARTVFEWGGQPKGAPAPKNRAQKNDHHAHKKKAAS